MRTLQTSKSILTWTLVISVLVTVASLFGLFDASIYGQETKNWATQAKGQDLGNLVAVITLLTSGYLYYKGSYRAALVWLGTLLYLIYAYIVYGVAVHFNALFLVYVAALGVSAYAVLFTVNGLRRHAGKTAGNSARKLAGYTIMAVGVLFSLLWLSELIPALFTGKVPQSVVDAGLWVNPIHVIDLAVVLPGFLLAGYLTLKSRPNGLFFVGPWLVFTVIMGTSIVAAMILMGLESGFAQTLPPMIMVSIVVIASFFATWRYLRQIN